MEDLSASFTAPNDREILFRSACLAIRRLGPCERWQDIAPPVQTAIRVIRAFRGASGHGVFWRGRPDWLTPERWAALDEESLSLRASAKPFHTYHRWTEGGAQAIALTEGPVRAFVEQIMGRSLGRAVATLNYYERPGEEAYAHIDHAEYEVNLLGVLSHEHDGAPRSALWVYPEGEDPREVTLAPGEFVLFHGGSTVHQRTPVGPGERVRVVTASYLVDNDCVPFP